MADRTSKIINNYVCTLLCQSQGNVGYLWLCPEKSGHMCHCTWGAEQVGVGGSWDLKLVLTKS